MHDGWRVACCNGRFVSGCWFFRWITPSPTLPRCASLRGRGQICGRLRDGWRVACRDGQFVSGCWFYRWITPSPTLLRCASQRGRGQICGRFVSGCWFYRWITPSPAGRASVRSGGGGRSVGVCATVGVSLVVMGGLSAAVGSTAG